MRILRLVATGGVVVVLLTVAACQSKATSSAPSSSAAASTSAAAVAAPTSAAASSAAPASAAASAVVGSAASAPTAAAGSGPVTFDGSYSGTLTNVLCVGGGPTTTASFNAAFTGKPGTFTGDISSTEFGFVGPDNTQFDSGFLNKALDTDGKGFVLDGIVAKDESGKSVTMHGMLVCP